MYGMVENVLTYVEKQHEVFKRIRQEDSVYFIEENPDDFAPMDWDIRTIIELVRVARVDCIMVRDKQSDFLELFMAIENRNHPLFHSERRGKDIAMAEDGPNCIMCKISELEDRAYLIRGDVITDPDRKHRKEWKTLTNGGETLNWYVPRILWTACKVEEILETSLVLLGRREKEKVEWDDEAIRLNEKKQIADAERKEY